MSSYNYFASLYDELTQNVDYKVRSDYISDFFINHSKSIESVLDLACGTGSITKHLCNKGFNVVGIDISEEMLSIASQKCPQASFYKADISDFELAERFDGCICSLDSINHLTTSKKWESCFRCVHNILNENGIFIFDVNTIYKHNNVLADNTFVFDEDDFFLSWDNELEEDNKVRILLDIFAYNGKNYDRYSEEFEEIAFSVEQIQSFLERYFEILGIYDDMTLNPPQKDSERIYFVCRKK